jgi:hypothetical protein
MKFIAVITAWHVDLLASIVKEIEAVNEDEAVGIAHRIASKSVDKFYSRHVEVIQLTNGAGAQRKHLTIKERLTGVADI